MPLALSSCLFLATSCPATKIVALEFFSPRMHIFKDALDAHIAGKWTLTIPAHFTRSGATLNASGNVARETGHIGSEVAFVFGLVVVPIGCRP